MEIAQPIIRALLVGVFAVAGIAKLADLEGSRDALIGFGVSERLARPGAAVVPIAELAVAFLLVFDATARVGAAAALALLAAFCIGIAGAMGRGETPDCHCAGQLHSAPADSRTLIRNGALAGLAALVLFA
jgi:hypothetical protein